MAVKVENNHVTLSVRDLIRSREHQQMISSFPLPQRGLLGQRAHTKVQRQKDRRFGLFHSEYSLRRTYPVSNYLFTVQGRIDGVYLLKNRVEIEEIKSVILQGAEFKRLRIERYPEFIEQVLFYAYLLQDELKGKEVRAYLILINLINEARRTFPISYNRNRVEQLLQQRLSLIVQNLEREKQELVQRKQKLAAVSFSLPEKRPQQQEMMRQISESLLGAEHLLISAPTGTGKTAAALFPTLRYAYMNNKKIFFLTSKTTQQNIVFQTLAPLIAQGLDVHILFLRASEKMCPNEVYFCHEAFCPYAKNYKERLWESNVLAELLEKNLFTPDLIYQKGLEYTLCPFELSMDLSTHCQLIVGDYNYIFDPAVYLRRLFFSKDQADWILIIDEAHNLYERGLAYLSPQLKYRNVLGLLTQSTRKKTKVYNLLTKALQEIGRLFEEMNLEGEIHFAGQQYFEPEINGAAWQNALELFESAFIKYLIYKVKKRILLMDDPFEYFYYDLRRFVQIARFQDRAFVPFYDARDQGLLKIQCCDPSHYLGSRIDAFHSVIAMSATLDPISFYQEVLGFPEERSAVLQLDSPFPAENRKVIIIPNISTRYRERLQNAPKIAEIIRKTLRLHSGNYLAFFPSFDFLQQVNIFLGNIHSEKILQKPGMGEAERNRILKQMAGARKPTLLMAVMGGIFSEGIDYMGKMAIGVIVVSPALPQISYERELLRRYYAEMKEMGMEYAYVYPGMNKVIQAVGRLIRSASDRGIVLLIGERFSVDRYHAVLPEYWFGSKKDVVMTSDYQKEIKDFWRKWKPA